MDHEFFISYRRADTQAAQKIWQALRDRGHRVFFDTDSLDAGDFTENIRAAIESCEMFVAILTERSLERMARDPETDMVRKELEYCRAARRLTQFFMLLDDPAAQKGRLYEVLKQYDGDELMRWIARQNITEFQGGDEPVDGVLGIAGVCGKILQAKADKVRALHFERKTCLGLGDRKLTYYGSVRRKGGDGEVVPRGQGRLVEDGKAEDFLVYDGEWEGGDALAGRGEIYIQGRDSRRLIYRGHWTDLLFDDATGTLYGPDGVTVAYRGTFAMGNMAGIGRAVITAGEQEVDFTGRFYGGMPGYGDLRIARGGREDVFRGSVYAPFRAVEVGVPFHTVLPKFGRMEYANGTVYEGEFGFFREKLTWQGWGTAEIPAPGFRLRAESFFDEGRPERRELPARVEVLPEGETEYRAVFSGGLRAGTLNGEIRFLNGTVFRGDWRRGDESARRGFGDGKYVPGAFFDAQGREFTPTDDQRDFYARQWEALIAPLLDWSDDRTAEELTRGEPLPLECPEAPEEEAPAEDGVWNEPELQNEFTFVLDMARSMGAPESVTARDVVDAILASPALAGEWRGLGSVPEREVFLLSKAPDIVAAMLMG